MFTIKQRKDDARKLNKRHTMEMNVNMAHMFYDATQQALLPTEQRTVTPESICKDLGVEFSKFETKPYVEAMKSEIDISYPKEIVDIIKAKKALAKGQSSSSGMEAGPNNTTSDLALRPAVLPPSGTASDSSALGK